MHRRTPAQVRNQLLRRPRRLRPVFFDVHEAEKENAEIQATCINRMQVFDAMPRIQRDRANRDGEIVVATWVQEQLWAGFEEL